MKIGPTSSGRRLYIMRHAKSSWKLPDLPDFARPLNGRGRRDAPRMGRLIAEEHGLPELVLCSAARRSVETYCAVAGAWTGWPELRVDPAFYGCGPDVWLDALVAVPETVGTVMLVGHMPAMWELLIDLVGAKHAPDRFPTAALAVVESNAPWPEITSAACRLLSFQMPRDL